MVRLRCLRGLRLVVLSCALLALTPLEASEAKADENTEQVLASAETFSDADKAALVLSQQGEGQEEPLYAGTSTWLLLSIALLGSIAVQRRADTLE